jgi:hypothetical protein
MLSHIVGAIAPSAFGRRRRAEEEEGAEEQLTEVRPDQRLPLLSAMGLVLIVRTPTGSPPEEKGSSRSSTHAAFLLPLPPACGAIRRCLLVLCGAAHTPTQGTTPKKEEDEEAEEERSALERVELHPGLTAFRLEAGSASFRVQTTRPLAVAPASSSLPRTATWRTTTSSSSSSSDDDARRYWLSDADMDVGRFARVFYARTGVAPEETVHYSAEQWPDARWTTGQLVCGARRTVFTRIIVGPPLLLLPPPSSS